MRHQTEIAIYAISALFLVGTAAIWWQGVQPSGSSPGVVEPTGFVIGSGVNSGQTGEGVSGGQGSPPMKTIYVHIDGAVQSPGVHEFPEGHRLFQALETVGLLDSADVSSLNLAGVLRDTQKVHVPKVGESTSSTGGGSNPYGGSSSGGSGTSSGISPDSPIDINTATRAELELLPGIGPVLAQAIIDWREEAGPFQTVRDLLEVSGIGEKTLARFEPYIVAY